ncbi:MAG: class I SAM-dependent methyltransferase [Anaerolineales bacterium]|nr:class I SAM-dependent methyltransferase [Anaerolineales bacterium]
MNIFRWLFYNFAYLKNPRWDTGISPPELMDFIAAHPPGKALDVGCGSGTNAITLVQRNWQVVGVDFIPYAIIRARLKARQANANAKFLLADASRLQDIGEPFNLVLDIGCFHSLSADERLRYICNLEHLLAPGGFFLNYTFINLSDETKHGISDRDLNHISKICSLVWRQDGLDHHDTISAWFCWEKRK